MERFVQPNALGDRRTVVRLDFTDQPANRRRWWFVNEAGQVELCLKDPGFEVDLYLSATLADMIHVWRGDISLASALGTGRLEVLGSSRVQRALPAWLALNPLARVSPARKEASVDGRRSQMNRSSNTTRALEPLAQHLRGPLLLPSQSDYETARRIWNGMIDRYPAAIARCNGAADVKDCVDFARDNGLSLSVRGGGHNIAGTAICDDGLVIDLSGLRSVHVDPERRRVRVAPGATLGDVDRETQAFGLVIPAGIVSTTGVAGLTLGGGFGWLSRKWGHSSDNLVAVDLVTADGAFRRASGEENPDLFWAIRGGGGNFGVVTSFEFEAHPLGREVMAGMVVHPFKRAREVIEFYREISETAPDELMCLLILGRCPPVPFLPSEIHGRRIATIVACYAGSPETAEKVMRPLKRFGQPLADIIKPKPFCAHQKLLDATMPKGRRYYWKSDYFSAFPAKLIDRLLEAAEALTSPYSTGRTVRSRSTAFRMTSGPACRSPRRRRWTSSASRRSAIRTGSTPTAIFR